MGMRRSWTKAVVALVATALGAVVLSSCDLTATCTVQWVGPVGGSYADGANWDTGSVPTPAQHACAAEGTSISISSPVDAGRLTSFGTVTVTTAGTLSVANAAVVDTLVVRGTLAGAGAVAAARFDLRNSTIDGSGPITALGPSTFVNGVTVRGSRALVLNGLTWGGTIRLCDTTSLAIRGTVRTAAPAGVTTTGCPAPGSPTFTVEPGATLQLGSTLTNDVPLRNQGTLAGSGAVTGAVVNAGTISPGAVTPIGSWTSYVGQLSLGSYTTDGNGLLIVDVNGETADRRDLVTVGADTTLGATGLIIRMDGSYAPALGTSYDALVVTGGHTLAADLPSPFVAYGFNGHWARSITGGTTLTITNVGCLPAGNYAGADLREADLHGCPLTGSNFTGADLSGANLTGATIEGVTFTEATMEGTNLTGTRLIVSYGGPRIRSGGIVGTPAALTTGMVLTQGYLVGPGTNLSGQDLTGASIVGADLTLSSLVGANLAGVVSSGITFTPEVCPPGPGGCASTAPTFSPGTMVRKGHLVGPGVDLRGVDLTGENLTSADLTGVTIGGADLSGTTGPGNGTGAAMVYDPSAPTRCSDGVLTGSAGVTTCAGRGPGW